ncbi:MAG: G5 domain-containing protein [Oscillospiraceae bacterium]|jgi:uncharacterized protein YabE (DUF348 family)/3D (Asp-Asp-Asp) domain-containing protein|nr:G5 domain-containing protein [Oscillospiraceae bacterium]
MDNLKSTVARVAYFLRKRTVAVGLLLAVCVIASVVVTANVTSVNIIDGGKQKKVITMRRNTKSILNQAGIVLAGDDEIVVDQANRSYKEITIFRAFDVVILADGKETLVKMAGGTIADALDEAGVTPPDADDIINYAIDDKIKADIKIQIDRVEYKTTTEEKTIPFNTEEVKTADLAKGKTKVQVKGVNGIKVTVYQQKFVNGELINSTVSSEKVTKKAVTKKVLVGTAVAKTQPKTQAKTTTTQGKANEEQKTTAATKKKSEDSTGGGTVVTASGKTLTYKKLITGSGTAYTAPAGAKTASGRPAQYGNVAVNPKVIPYGTRLYIVSTDGKFVYGEAVAADTGSALKNGNAVVDLFYNTKAECYSFGRRNVKIYVL